MAEQHAPRKVSAAQRRDLYQEVTDQIIAAIENGTAPWQRPWDEISGAGLPMNGASGRPYSGVNAMLLLMTAHAEGHTDPRWFTFKQANELGVKVRKGSRSTPVYFFKMLDVNGEDEQPRQGGKDGKTGKGEDGQRRIPFLTEYRVFHASQLEGLAPLESREREWTPLEAVQRVVDRLQPDIRIGGDRAFYAPGAGRDYIQMPPHGAFPDAARWAGTLLHEIGHWTGAEHRLNRNFGKWGTDEYAQEELRAELSSAFLCAELGVPTPMDNHAAYVGSWVKRLKEDKFEIFRAARDARGIADYVMGRSPMVEVAGPQPAEVTAQSVIAPVGPAPVQPAQPLPETVERNPAVVALLARAQQAARQGASTRTHGPVAVSTLLPATTPSGMGGP
jgi:antirestriction protein ArdC